jgi:hypothetical protein
MCFVLAHGLLLLGLAGTFFFQSEASTVRYARTNVIGSRNFFVIAPLRSSIH